MTTSKTQSETRSEYHAALRVNLDRGRWAVAIVGRREWGRDAAIGDGITTATYSLVTRCESKEEAARIAAELNELEPRVTPGGAGAWVFEARPYKRNDYIGRQNIERNQTRDADRRIANL